MSNPIAVAIMDEGVQRISTAVKGHRELLIGHAELGIAVVLEIVGVEIALRLEVPHQPSHAIGVLDGSHKRIPDDLLIGLHILFLLRFLVLALQRSLIHLTVHTVSGQTSRGLEGKQPSQGVLSEVAVSSGRAARITAGNQHILHLAHSIAFVTLRQSFLHRRLIRSCRLFGAIAAQSSGHL